MIKVALVLPTQTPSPPRRRQDMWNIECLERALEVADPTIRVHVQDFEGELNFDDYYDQIAFLKAFFDWRDLPEDKNVCFMTTKLKGHAFVL